MKPVLILQLRVLDGPADDEYYDFLKYGRLNESDVLRVRMEKESFSHLNPKDFSAIIVGGGPSNVSDDERIKPDYQKRFEKELDDFYKIIFENDIPYMGSCYGFGSVASYAGARISKERFSEEVGYVKINLSDSANEDDLLRDLPGSFFALCGHKEACQNLPEEAVLLAGSDQCPIQMLRFKNNIYATQFHCELDAQGIAARIRYYKDHGYFEPHMADELIERTKNIDTAVPHEIFRRFVEKYC